MKLCKRHVVRLCLILLAAVPAYCQRGTFGVDVGETSDRFGALPRSVGAEADVDGQLVVYQGKNNDKGEGADIVAGGEIRLPTDTQHHSTEFAIFGGPEFLFSKGFTAGVHIQVRKIILPPSTVDNQVFNRDTMELLEIPGFLQYKFLSSKRAFIRAEGGMEFSPRLHPSSSGPNSLPDPRLDHGYFARGVLGYNFSKWYVKGTYETRYFKFRDNATNPSDLYNWRSDLATVGVGINF